MTSWHFGTLQVNCVKHAINAFRGTDLIPINRKYLSKYLTLTLLKRNDFKMTFDTFSSLRWYSAKWAETLTCWLLNGANPPAHQLNILRMFPRIKINIQGVVKLKCFEELLQHSGVSILFCLVCTAGFFNFYIDTESANILKTDNLFKRQQEAGISRHLLLMS